jgi:metallophosphoesterase (TIGR00282 family)
VRILCLADVVGRPGREALAAALPALRREHRPALVIANGENLAGGFGVTRASLRECFAAGVDVVTSGNHVWDRREGVALLEEEPRLLRPANYPPDNPGYGRTVVETAEGKVGVLNLQGRVFLPPIDDPLRVGRRHLEEMRQETAVLVVDFHAEATAEKQAFARYVDGLASAVVGTHTHVPTADAQILPGGTAYVTDLGMTGSHAGVIGHRADAAIERVLRQTRVRLEPATGDLRVQGVWVEVDPRSGRALAIERIEVRIG